MAEFRLGDTAFIRGVGPWAVDALCRVLTHDWDIVIVDVATWDDRETPYLWITFLRGPVWAGVVLAQELVRDAVALGAVSDHLEDNAEAEIAAQLRRIGVG